MLLYRSTVLQVDRPPRRRPPCFLRGGGSAEGEAEASPVRERRRETREREAYERGRYGFPSHQSAPFSRYSGKGDTGKPNFPAQTAARPGQGTLPQ